MVNGTYFDTMRLYIPYLTKEDKMWEYSVGELITMKNCDNIYMVNELYCQSFGSNIMVYSYLVENVSTGNCFQVAAEKNMRRPDNERYYNNMFNFLKECEL